MRYKTMERYRRAAALLRSHGLEATPKALAKKLGLSPKHMHDMLNKYPELRTYAGIVRDMDSRKRRYEAVIALLEKEGRAVTAAAVAHELDMTISGVYRYEARLFQRREHELAKQLSSRSRALQELYRRAVERIRREGHPLTRKSLAMELQKPLTTVQQYLWAHPEFCNELGIEYTDEPRRRVYAKRSKDPGHVS